MSAYVRGRDAALDLDYIWEYYTHSDRNALAAPHPARRRTPEAATRGRITSLAEHDGGKGKAVRSAGNTRGAP